MTINSDLIYDVLKRHQPDHFLLKATRIDAAKGLTDISRLNNMLKKFEGKIEVKFINKATPLAVPILLEIGKETIHGEVENLLLEDYKDNNYIKNNEIYIKFIFIYFVLNIWFRKQIFSLIIFK